jgi:hypothetical protein
MRIGYLLLCFAIGLGTVQADPDDIDSFVKDFDGERMNGIWPVFDLPADTPPEKIVDADVHMRGNERDEQLKGYRIVEVRKIADPKSELNGYTVVLIASEKGSKTILVLGYRFGKWTVHTFYITTVR